MEYEHGIRQYGTLNADDARDYAISLAIRKFWEVLDNLELFLKYNSTVQIHEKDGEEREFNWQIVCDREEYEPEHEPNTTVKASQEDFVLLEACLRRTSWFVTKDRYPSRQELLRIAMRFRAITIRYWNSKEKTGKEIGISTPNGFLPVF
jgi:hypothetical protein